MHYAMSVHYVMSVLHALRDERGIPADDAGRHCCSLEWLAHTLKSCVHISLTLWLVVNLESIHFNT